MKVSPWIISVLFAAAFQLHAQHYPAGSEGIKAGSLPPPGIYVEDYNSFYFFNHTPGFGGQLNLLEGFNYVQSPRLMWMTDLKFLGADYGMAVRVPVAYKQLTHRVTGATAGGGAGPIPGGVHRVLSADRRSHRWEVFRGQAAHYQPQVHLLKHDSDWRILKSSQSCCRGILNVSILAQDTHFGHPQATLISKTDSLLTILVRAIGLIHSHWALLGIQTQKKLGRFPC